MKKLNKKGFTIVELVIVIAVIAILAAVLIPTFSGVVDKANKSAALQNAKNEYTQMSIAAASIGSTVEDGTIFADKDSKYFYQLTDGELTALDTFTATTTYTKVTTDNSVVYVKNNSNGACQFDFAPTGLKTGFSEGLDKYYSSKWSHVTDKTSIIMFRPATTPTAEAATTLTIKNDDGNVVFKYSGTCWGCVDCCMFYEGNMKSGSTYTASVYGVSGTTKAGDATDYTYSFANNKTAADAEGWYSYTYTFGTSSMSGYFYYAK